jgi:membrane protein
MRPGPEVSDGAEVSVRVRAASWWRAARSTMHGNDLLLLAGGVTFYAAIAVVPGLFVALRLATLVVGRGHVLHSGAGLADALPTELGAPAVAHALVGRAVDRRWWNVVVAVLPASLYGEGLRRALAALGDPSGPRAPETVVGWRGRLALLPVLAAAPGLLLLLLAFAPRVGHLLGTGGRADVGGVVLAFTVDWLLVSGPLMWVFRVVAPDPPGWAVAAVGGLLTGSFVAGFLQGFVLFLSLPLDLGAPFGGLTAIGGVCAVLLWLWVLHLVVLTGFTLTRAAAGQRLSSGSSPTLGSPASA